MVFYSTSDNNLHFIFILNFQSNLSIKIYKDKLSIRQKPMNEKEIIVRELDRVPNSLLPKVLEFVKSVQDTSQIEQLETTLLSEAALAQDWLAPEEDEAWQDL